MEQLNRIQLRGIIGSLRITEVQGKKIARISVATNYCFRDAEGVAVIETTWHNVTAWEKGPYVTDFDKLEKGKAVFVEGRLVTQRYTGADGEARYTYEVRANALNIIEEPLTMETF